MDVTVSRDISLATRWIALLVAHHEPNFAKEAAEVVRAVDNAENEMILSVLCSGVLYAATTSILLSEKDNSLLLPKSLFSPPNDNDTPQPHWSFLTTLVTHNYCQFDPSMIESIQEMLSDAEPFYESVHATTFSGLLSAYASPVTLEDVTLTISSLPLFVSTRDTPYDMEDALFIWLHLVSLLHLEKEYEESYADDVFTLFRNNQLEELLVNVTRHYYPVLDEANFIDACHQIGLFVPWTSEWSREPMDTLGKKIMTSFLCRLFCSCVLQKGTFKPLSKLVPPEQVDISVTDEKTVIEEKQGNLNETLEDDEEVINLPKRSKDVTLDPNLIGRAESDSNIESNTIDINIETSISAGEPIEDFLDHNRPHQMVVHSNDLEENATETKGLADTCSISSDPISVDEQNAKEPNNLYGANLSDSDEYTDVVVQNEYMKEEPKVNQICFLETFPDSKEYSEVQNLSEISSQAAECVSDDKNQSTVSLHSKSPEVSISNDEVSLDVLESEPPSPTSSPKSSFRNEELVEPQLPLDDSIQMFSSLSNIPDRALTPSNHHDDLDSLLDAYLSTQESKPEKQSAVLKKYEKLDGLMRELEALEVETTEKQRQKRDMVFDCEQGKDVDVEILAFYDSRNIDDEELVDDNLDVGNGKDGPFEPVVCKQGRCTLIQVEAKDPEIMLKKREKVMRKLRENSADVTKTKQVHEIVERTKSAIRREKLEENRRVLQEKAQQRMIMASEEMENPRITTSSSSKEKTPGRRKSIPKSPGKSNKALIKNALIQVLAGPVYEKIKSEVLEDLETSAEENFVVILRSPKNHTYRALYSYCAELDQTLKIHGSGPDTLSADLVSDFYKYDSGSRTFRPLPTKSFGISTHAVVLNTQYKTKSIKRSW